MNDQNKNLILATALSFLVIMVWMIIFPPEMPPPEAETPAEVATAPEATAPNAAPAAGAETTALAEAPRIPIATARLSGSISLLGGRIDDLSLTDYRISLEPGAPNIQLFSPLGTAYPYYALQGWTGANLPQGTLPGPDTLWSVEGTPTLTPETPVTLTWDNGAGLIFRRTISVDADYLFTLADTVENTTEAPVTLQSYSFIARHGRAETPANYILHEGVVRLSDGALQEIKYADLPEHGTAAPDGTLTDDIAVAENGWIGFTDKYWMATLIPAPGEAFRSSVRVLPASGIYQTFAWAPEATVAPGATVTQQGYLFAGAKEWEVIRAYESTPGIDRFVDSIDWGWFWFFTKPIFQLLHWLHGLIGNMGWAIIALTFVIKLLVLPLAYKSYVSMARMKELQPEMEKLKETAGEDRAALQQGMMKLYRENKVNPASGCLPLLIQIPIFFSLYKVIVVTIELYHEPWFGWIRDLSAPDPSSLFNAFGLLPWGPPELGSILHIIFLGILPLILGVSMWLQQKLNPAPTDPTQKVVFAWMPWIFMFMMGSFASGLIVYWITNNVITFAQQYIIMRSHGHNPDLFGNITSSFRRDPPAANTDKKPGGK